MSKQRNRQSIDQRKAREFSRRVRKAAGYPGSSWPIVVVPGKSRPQRCGRPHYWTTPGGTEVRHPNAYGWPTVYHHSQRKIEVGWGWLRARKIPLPARVWIDRAGAEAQRKRDERRQRRDMPAQPSRAERLAAYKRQLRLLALRAQGWTVDTTRHSRWDAWGYFDFRVVVGEQHLSFRSELPTVAEVQARLAEERARRAQAEAEQAALMLAAARRREEENQRAAQAAPETETDWDALMTSTRTPSAVRFTAEGGYYEMGN